MYSSRKGSFVEGGEWVSVLIGGGAVVKSSSSLGTLFLWAVASTASSISSLSSPVPIVTSWMCDEDSGMCVFLGSKAAGAGSDEDRSIGEKCG